jgi:hypothetical protein
MSGHRCRAVACAVEVEPHLLMCKRHWFMVPKPLRQRVWQTYRAGDYLDAAKAAIAAIAAVEEREFGGRLL